MTDDVRINMDGGRNDAGRNDNNHEHNSRTDTSRNPDDARHHKSNDHHPQKIEHSWSKRGRDLIKLWTTQMALNRRNHQKESDVNKRRSDLLNILIGCVVTITTMMGVIGAAFPENNQVSHRAIGIAVAIISAFGGICIVINSTMKPESESEKHRQVAVQYAHVNNEAQTLLIEDDESKLPPLTDFLRVMKDKVNLIQLFGPPLEEGEDSDLPNTILIQQATGIPTLGSDKIPSVSVYGDIFARDSDQDSEETRTKRRKAIIEDAKDIMNRQEDINKEREELRELSKLLLQTQSSANDVVKRQVYFEEHREVETPRVQHREELRSPIRELRAAEAVPAYDLNYAEPEERCLDDTNEFGEFESGEFESEEDSSVQTIPTVAMHRMESTTMSTQSLSHPDDNIEIDSSGETPSILARGPVSRALKRGGSYIMDGIGGVSQFVQVDTKDGKIKTTQIKNLKKFIEEKATKLKEKEEDLDRRVILNSALCQMEDGENTRRKGSNDLSETADAVRTSPIHNQSPGRPTTRNSESPRRAIERLRGLFTESDSAKEELNRCQQKKYDQISKATRME